MRKGFVQITDDAGSREENELIMMSEVKKKVKKSG